MPVYIRFVHADQNRNEAELRGAILAAVERHTGSRESVDLVPPTEVKDDLVVYLGSAAGAGDQTCLQRVAEMLDRGGWVLPVVPDLRRYRDYVPQRLEGINGCEWTSAAEIAELILRKIGLTESDRRLFLSYRRVESTPLALQLYDELHHRRYSVFLDVFEVEAAVPVQNRISEALQEMAFVLLLESRDVRSSRWVEEEIGYALEYGLGLLALAEPGVPDDPAFKMVPEANRERLRRADLDGDDRLTPEALRRIILRIEREHADQLRARRERMLSDISELLEEEGRPVRRLGPTSLIRTGPNRQTIISVCARPPAPRDLFGLGREREATENMQEAWLIGTRGGYSEGREITEWIAESLTRPIRWFVPTEVADAARNDLD